jgi:hypothetical protein
VFWKKIIHAQLLNVEFFIEIYFFCVSKLSIDLFFKLPVNRYLAINIEGKVGGLFWILLDSNVSLEEQIWLTECIYLADHFKLRKKKEKTE